MTLCSCRHGRVCMTRQILQDGMIVVKGPTLMLRSRKRLRSKSDEGRNANSLRRCCIPALRQGWRSQSIGKYCQGALRARGTPCASSPWPTMKALKREIGIEVKTLRTLNLYWNYWIKRPAIAKLLWHALENFNPRALLRMRREISGLSVPISWSRSASRMSTSPPGSRHGPRAVRPCTSSIATS